MLIAKQKRQENIAEYVLYMWQLEDMLRACNFDVDVLMRGFNLSPLEMPKVRQWYQDMADAMKAEGIQKKGHLVFKSCIFLYVKNYLRFLQFTQSLVGHHCLHNFLFNLR